MNLLDILAVRHQDWVKMVGSFGCPPHMCEDLVQEMYLRMYRLVDSPDKVMYGDDINTYYVYVVLRNMYADYRKVKDKVHYTDVDSLNLPHEVETSPEAEQAYAALIQSLKIEISSWHWYDAKLFTIYAESDKSMRTISSESKISLRSIFNTIKNGKQRIKQSEANNLYKAWKEAKSQGPW